MIPVIDSKSCIRCGDCVEVCPPQAISLSEEGAMIEEEFCEECGFCAASCPSDAIKIIFDR